MPQLNFDLQRVNGVAEAIRTRLGTREVQVAITLGSGLGGFGGDLPGAIEMPYEELGLPRCGAQGHAGIARFVTIGRIGVLIYDGRAHRYEGHDFETVVMAVRAAMQVGADTQIITCASGGVNAMIPPGSLALISDHLNLMGGSPLVGGNVDKMGTRFPDMTEAYSEQLRFMADKVARRIGIELLEGVYAALLGPSYETPAEVRMLRVLDADMVGMSTVPEVIALRHMGASVLGISCVANPAAGVTGRPLSHKEVQQECAKTAPIFRQLLTGIIEEMQAD